jgi:Tol biopolymer transport system component
MPRVQCLNTFWLLGGLLAGCGDDLTAPERGSIEVTSTTAGDPTDTDGYTLAVDGVEGRALGTNSTLSVSDLSAGDHELTLGGIAPNCVLTGPNPRTVTVTSGATARTTFELECSAPTGSIEVTTVTTGESPDPDGYSAGLDGAPSQPVGTNETITFAGVISGDHTVSLTGIASNCTVGGDNPRTVAVGADAARTMFDITCGPPTGTIVISTTTGGPRPDLDGYVVSVDGGSGQAIGTNGTLTLPGLPLGDHTVQLSGVAPNCTVGGENPRVVSVTNGGAAPVAFQVSCFATGVGSLLFASDRTGTSHLYSMREDGSRIVDLTPSMESFDGDWSPDGSRIVFTTTRNEGLSIFVMNADGSNPVGLGVSGGRPRWSPDGRKILWSDGTIRVMNADGSQVVALTAGRSPDWSPDGTRIAFDRIDRSGCIVDFCPADIFVMAADGSQIRKLTSSNPADQSTGASWSPDGTRIAYARRCCLFGPNQSGLWVISPDGGSPNRINTQAATGTPVWSPDGLAIAFAAALSNSTTELTVIPSSGGTGVVLASSPASEYPTSWK